jgi:hypothetical protein
MVIATGLAALISLVGFCFDWRLVTVHLLGYCFLSCGAFPVCLRIIFMIERDMVSVPCIPTAAGSRNL